VSASKVGRARGRRNQDAVGDQFGKPHLAVDREPQFRGLVGFAKQINLIDRGRAMAFARDVDRFHGEWMDHGTLGRGNPLL
jgi:hypothetical protein